MTFQFNPGCNCCDAGTCLIHTEDWPAGSVPSEWRSYNGTWTIATPFSGAVETSTDNAMLVFFPQPQKAFHITCTITSDTPLQTSGVIVGFKDTANYIYIKVLWPLGDPSGTDGYIAVVDVRGGIETTVQTPYVLPSSGLSLSSIGFEICLFDAHNGNQAVVQYRAITIMGADYIHACVPTIQGNGYGFWTNSLLSGEFSGLGEASSYHNWRSSLAIARDPEVLTTPTDCECICQCQNCLDTAPPKELKVTFSGFGGSGAPCGNPSFACTALNGITVIATCQLGSYQSIDNGPGEDVTLLDDGVTWKTTCRWYGVISVPATAGVYWLHVELSERWTLIGAAYQFDGYALSVLVWCYYDGGPDPIQSGQFLAGSSYLGMSKPTMYYISEDIIYTEMSGASCIQSGALMRITAPSIESCP